MNIIYCILLILLIGIIAYGNSPDIGPTNKNVEKGYSVKSDTIPIILERINWVSNYPGRVSWKIRYLLYSVIMSIISFIILNKKIELILLIRLTFILWFLLLMLHSFFSHHADKFSAYAIQTNIKKIQKKLKIQKTKILKGKIQKFPSNSDCSNFTYTI